MDYPTRDEIRSLCTQQSFERGVNYYEQGRVLELDIDGDEIRATVRGSYDYDVSIRVESDVTSLGSIERGYYPDSSDYWDWETLYPEFDEGGFDWEPDVRERLRTVVEDCGLAQQLPDEWTFADIVV